VCHFGGDWGSFFEKHAGWAQGSDAQTGKGVKGHKKKKKDEIQNLKGGQNQPGQCDIKKRGEKWAPKKSFHSTVQQEGKVCFLRGGCLMRVKGKGKKKTSIPVGEKGGREGGTGGVSCEELGKGVPR